MPRFSIESGLKHGPINSTKTIKFNPIIKNEFYYYIEDIIQPKFFHVIIKINYHRELIAYIYSGITELSSP